MALIIDAMDMSRSHSTDNGTMARQTKIRIPKIRQTNWRIWCHEELTLSTWFDERRNLLDTHSPLLSAASTIDPIDIAWKDGVMLRLV